MGKNALVCCGLMAVIVTSICFTSKNSMQKSVHKNYVYAQEERKVTLKYYNNKKNKDLQSEIKSPVNDNTKKPESNVSKNVAKQAKCYVPNKSNLELKLNNSGQDSRGGYISSEANKQMVMEATAYTNSYQDTGKNAGDAGYGITATGTVAKIGTVAVDPSVIPLRSKLYITSMDGSKSYGYAVAEDTGSAIKGYKIDLFYNTETEALEFGRRKVKVSLLKN